MIGLAIVGLGRWGHRHIASAEGTGRFRIVRAIDVRPESASDLAERGIPVSAEIEDALGDPDVQAVSLVTPHTLHPRQVAACAAAGKHVLTEKPFALSAAEARMAADACVGAGVVLGLGHDNRFYPAVQALADLVRDGALGQIHLVEANISHDYALERGRRLAREGQRSEPRPDDPPGPAWRDDVREAPAGSMVQVGVHRIDTFVQIFGRMTQVFGLQSPPPADAPSVTSGAMLVRFASGTTGYLGSSQATPLLSRIHVFGTDAWAELRGPSDQAAYERASLDRLTVQRNTGEIETREFDDVDSVARNYLAFADAIDGKAAYPISPDEMVHGAEVLEAVARSFHLNEPVQLG